MSNVACFVGLGSNLGDSVATLRAAVQQLAALPETRVHRVSRCVRSKPLGSLPQNDYINAV
ncbi:MAG: 2-amino-4-hydroxy-6-hydroxymethyldihydropteridine diphosphokinase, partial [Gammaproteobacteria bacterium]|nr:2-amino-4-hydroxy-6-hydroxymethyldihydropteridine diphosphokinase [Gammaproteobacteria bacterium]